MLSRAEVVAASRKFICVRPLTYEDKTESDYLRKVFSRNGALENTVFAILDPAAGKYLAAPGRSPEFSFPEIDEGLAAFAKALDKLVSPYQEAKPPTTLPLVKDLRYALNVAACDRRPLMILPSEDGTLRAKIAELAWKEEFQGQFVFVIQSPKDDPTKIAARSFGSHVLFVQPDEYGVSGTVIGAVDPTGDIAPAMRQAISAFKPSEFDHRTHLAAAVRKGIRWKPTVPEEDRASIGAVERLWGGN